jgi:WD40 repeat protein
MGCSNSYEGGKLKEISNVFAHNADTNNSTRTSFIFKSNNKIIIIGTFDGMLQMFSLNDKTGKLTELASQQAHDDMISSIIELDDNKIITSSFDNNIKIYSINQNNFQELHAYYSHENSINQIVLLDDTKDFASCSMDKTIRIFSSSEPYKEKAKIIEDKPTLSITQLNTGIIGSIHKNIERKDGAVIYFWKIQEGNNTLQKVHTIEGTDNFQPLFIWALQAKLFAVSSESQLTIFDSEKYQKIKVISHQIWNSAPTSVCQYQEDYLYVACSGYICQIFVKDYNFYYFKKINEMDEQSRILVTNDEKLVMTAKESNLYIFKFTFV